MPTTFRDLPASSGPVYLEDEIEADIWNGRQTARIKWFCDYIDKDRFAETVFGRFETISYTFGSMVRRVPMQHPRYPALIANHLSMKMHSGFDVTAAALNAFDAYETVECTVSFAIPLYQTSGSTPYMSVSKNTTVDTLTVPNQSLRYLSDSSPVQQDMFMWIPVDHISVVIHQMQRPDPPGLTAAASAPLNSATFYTPFGSYPAGTVQYLSSSQPGQVYQGGFTTYSLAVNFKCRPFMRWDYRLREDGTGSDQVVYPSGSGFIPSSDLNLIFAF